jgi:cytochrome d ubiquinol oxidase subunit II
MIALTLGNVVAGVILVALTVYILTGGADFGGGVWDLLATGSRARMQREVIARAVGPIWEANHVWLIVVIVLLFVCFPLSYAAIATALHVPLVIMLLGIVLRGAAFAFRSHDYGGSQARWDAVFAVASLVTPITFGMCVGAIGSGGIRIGEDGTVTADFLRVWTTPFCVAVGLFTLSLLAHLAATYLLFEAEHEPLREDFRVRGLVSGVITGILAFVVLFLARDAAPEIWAGLFSPLGWVIRLLTGGAAIAAMFGLWTRRWFWARLGAMLTVTGVLWGWGFSQFPYLIVPDLRIERAAASDAVLGATLIVLVLGAIPLVPSFIWLYRVFKAPVLTRQ